MFCYIDDVDLVVAIGMDSDGFFKISIYLWTPPKIYGHKILLCQKIVVLLQSNSGLN